MGIVEKNRAARWAANILEEGTAVILDTETTGFAGEVIELTVVDLKGETLYSGRFCPIVKTMNPHAFKVHGISIEDLANEPQYPEQINAISEAIGGRLVLIYNQNFDVKRMDYTASINYVEPVKYKSECVMIKYSEFVGEKKRGGRGYKWQKLPKGDHTAVGDCLATLEVIRKMASHIESAEVWPSIS